MMAAKTDQMTKYNSGGMQAGRFLASWLRNDDTSVDRPHIVGAALAPPTLAKNKRRLASRQNASLSNHPDPIPGS
ncbi:MAG TPA: hypothetical protein DGB32_09340 [Dehalococcoidia bacterium]|nr:hypothetical protein [Chloroflexota bacterium]HCV28518.1 hypothetical protein [Dehalococcoidia bacterium]